MRSERAQWREKVRRWKKSVEEVEQGLEGSKVSATDFVGDKPRFNPSPAYLAMIAEQANHLSRLVAKNDQSSVHKRTRREAQLRQYWRILHGDTENQQ